MSQYPELNEKKELDFEKTDTTRMISTGITNIKNQAKELIQRALNKQLKGLQREMNEVPTVYNNLRNQATNQFLSGNKKMEEALSNTGNHTASGYAMSKRMNSQNQHNKNIAALNTAQEKARATYLEKMADAQEEAKTKKLQAENQYNLLALEKKLAEQNKADEYRFSTAKLNMEGDRYFDEFMEKKRVNDANIQKGEAQMELDKNKDRRADELHEIEKKYLPETYQADLDLTYEKYRTQQADTQGKIAQNNKISQAKQGNTTTKSSSASSSTNSSSATKVSAKDLAGSIEKLAGVKRFDETGKAYYEIDANKAYTYLMSWKNKYNLSWQVVNDVAIYLGIQDFI